MNTPLILLIFFLCLDSGALALFFLFKQRQKGIYRREIAIRNLIIEKVLDGSEPSRREIRRIRRNRRLALSQLALLNGAMHLNSEESRRTTALFDAAGIISRLEKSLSSHSARARFASALYLRFLRGCDERSLLARRLRRERRSHVRLALVKALLDSSRDEDFDAIAESLRWGGTYVDSVGRMMSAAGHRFIGWATRRLSYDDPRYKIAILSGARVHTTQLFRNFAQRCLSDRDEQVRRAALGCARTYPEILTGEREEELDPEVEETAIRYEVFEGERINLDRYCGYLRDSRKRRPAVEGLRAYVNKNPTEIDRLLEYLRSTNSDAERSGLALSLVGRLPFLLANRYETALLIPIIKTAVSAGFNAGLISFLNINRDKGLRKKLVQILRSLTRENPEFRESCLQFLKPDIREDLGIEADEERINKPRIPISRRDKRLMIVVFVLIVAVPVAILFYRYDYPTASFPLLEFARYSVYSFTAVFAWYTVSLNTIYLVLLFMAVLNLRRQNSYWRLQDQDFLFTPGVIPSVAILAPAYNEEKNVVESVNSLLTLIYPDYQVIVINDGSQDDTIDTLRRKFQLVRIDRTPVGSLNTAPVRGVYSSPLNRRLLVIDKENGGKADALNCGINYASREYICSIDSDSLLEPDSLLRMTTEAMSGRRETIAVGGNILPVNGCLVEHGALQRIALPGARYARFQTIEYLRSFIAGRLGWAQLNALLIISGAFGLFRRERVLEIGGYLTGRGEHRRDTVGEDMELVVRLIRLMGDKRRPYRVSYAATANCWTEVPEDLKSIYKQRDRWHRGLVEIMTYHKRMLFNPRYGSTGLIALPYFFIFEIIGPFYELTGYAALVVGFATGVLSPAIFILMFTVVVLFGSLISLISLILSENGIVYFKRFEVLHLVWITFIESFGYRQLMGWVRVFSAVGMLYKIKGWQKLERKGFSRESREGNGTPGFR